jgi:hypothetical protein
MSALVRDALKQALVDMVVAAYADGSAPYRTGQMQKALISGARAFGSNFNDIRAYIYGPVSAKAHNVGSTIFPSEAAALTIPLPAALRADGTPKLGGPNSWRNVGTFIFRSKKTGKSYIAYKSAAGDLILLYMFVDKVQLRKYKGFLDRAWEGQKGKLGAEIGAILMTEMATIDLAAIARIAT